MSFDSRSVQSGQLFVPIVAERNGHEFIDAAVSRGAAAFLTAEPERVTPHGTAVVVDDTTGALLRLGQWGRERWGLANPAARVIGVTGSVGKTSTKDMALAALSSSARTWANERSFNNDQGLPSTILNAPDDTEVMVLEMGMRGFGEIERLAAIGQPHIGVVTRVAEAHSERVGGIYGVARAKAELVIALPSDGFAILNGDDPLVREMAAVTSATVVLFGSSGESQVRFDDVVLDDLARATFTLHSPWGHHLVRLGVSGAHMVGNAAAALACAGVLGLDVAAAAAALGDVRISAHRMDVRRLASGSMLLDDTYNANPTSMRAALDALVALPATRRIAILGVMAEIDEPEREHRAIADYARAREITVVAVGTDAYGSTPHDDPVAFVGSLAGGDALLVKASRAAGLERVASAIVEACGGFVAEGGFVIEGGDGPA